MGKGFALVVVLVFLTASSTIVILPISGATTDENTWVEKAPMHVARSSVGIATAGGKIYAIGGSTGRASPSGFGNAIITGRGVVDTNEEYDPTKNVWTYKKSMPTGRQSFATASYQNKIYCVGGYDDNGTLTSVNEVYDSVTDTWTSEAPLPIAGFLQANLVGEKIFFIGGGANGTTLNEVYNTNTDSWSLKTPMPLLPPNFVSAVIGNQIYVFGYWEDLSNHVKAATLIYDSKNDIWSYGKPIPSRLVDDILNNRGDFWTAGACATTGIMSSIRIYLFFMQYTYLGPIPILAFNPVTNDYVECANQPSNRQRFGIAVIDDLIYTIGGYSDYYPGPDDNLHSITESAANERYVPFGYGISDTSYLPPDAFVSPRVYIQSPLNHQYSQSNVSLIFTVDKTNCWATYSLDGEANQTISSNVTLMGLTYSIHNVTVYANDAFGNMGSSETVSFTVIEEPKPFPIILVAAIAVVAVVAVVVAAGLLVYHKKHARRTNP